MEPDRINGSPRQVAEWLLDAKTAVAFTGAGVSTESGIPDFRSPQGIWARSKPVEFDEFLRTPEARHEYWRQKPKSTASRPATTSVAGLVAQLRSGKTPALVDVLTVMLCSGLLGLALALLWYVRYDGAEHPWFMIGVSWFAGIGGMGLVDSSCPEFAD